MMLDSGVGDTPKLVSSVSLDGLLLGSHGPYSELAGAVFLAKQGPQWFRK